jgi:integrase
MLTAKRVERCKTPGRYRDGTVPGLYLQISESGARSYVLRYQLNKQKERMLGIGPAAILSLKEARSRARAARLLLLDGIDPIDQRRKAKADAAAAAAKAITFREAAQRYFDANEAAWSSASHRDAFLSTLGAHAFPMLGDMDVAAIAVPDVLRALEPLWKTKTITADRVRSRVESVLDWAVVRGHRSPGTNPAKWPGVLDQVLPPPRKVAPIRSFAAMPYADVPAFMRELRGDDTLSARALEFAILTAARSGEVRQAEWSEIDFEQKIWTVPAPHTKTRREHRIPLAPAVIDLLQALPREKDNAFIFVGTSAGSGLSRMAFQHVLARLGCGDTVHGFRSSFRDWSGEVTSYPHDVCEAALAHVRGDQSVRAYARGDLFDKRRKLMDAWAEYCATPAAAKTGNVVGIGGGR